MCKVRLAFWVPSIKAVFIGDLVIEKDAPFNIFYNEALTVLAALKWSTSLNPTSKCVAIHTDLTNSLNIFNSLHASDVYNPILMSAVMIQINYNIDLRVFHIEGKKNNVANALSRSNFKS